MAAIASCAASANPCREHQSRKSASSSNLPPGSEGNERVGTTSALGNYARSFVPTCTFDQPLTRAAAKCGHSGSPSSHPSQDAQEHRLQTVDFLCGRTTRSWSVLGL